MREFKFRAYNKEIKKMIFLDPLQWPLRTLNEEENCKVMQWTGLVDAQGTDIYEGDIVKVEHSVRTGTKLHYNRYTRVEEAFSINEIKTGYAVVDWDGFQYICKSNLYDDYDSYFFVSKRRDVPQHIQSQLIMSIKEANIQQVIGNIYENPELLVI